MDVIQKFVSTTGLAMLFEDPRPLVMIFIACLLLYLAIKKGFEPLLLIPIAFGMLLSNLPGTAMYHAELFEGGHVHWMPPAPRNSQDCVSTQSESYKSRKERAVNGSFGFLNLRSCDFHPVHRKLTLDKSLQK